MGKGIEAVQRDLLAAIFGSDPGFFYCDLSPGKDYMSFVFAPANRLTLGVVRITAARQLLYFLVDKGLHH